MDPKSLVERFLSGGYRAPAGDLAGVRTVVEEKPAKGIDDALGDTIEHPPGESPKSDRERAAPQRTDNNRDLENDLPGPPVYNTPGPAVSPRSPPSPKPESKFKMRTPGTPGEEYGHPYKENVYPRRTEAAGAGMFPTYSERQHKNKSQAKRYYQKYYRRRKSLIETRAKRRYNRVKNQPSFRRRKSLRNNEKYKNRFRRLPAGGATSISQLSKRQREKHEKRAGALPISFYHEWMGWGDLLGFDDEGPIVHLDGEGESRTVSLGSFLRGMVFESEEELGDFFSALDQAYGDPDPREVAATFYREVFRAPYNMDPGPGAQDLGLPSQTNPHRDLEYPNSEHDERAPGHKLEVGEMHGAPGSAKVIPSGRGFVNKEASTPSAMRVAKRLADLLGETSSDVLLKSKKLRPKGKRFDKKNSMYTFSVPGQTSANTYTVQMKVSRVGKATKLGKMDLLVSCSCPFWQWQGPEHWAKVGSYLYGTPRGTASKPSIKDPRSLHKVCKHVAACLEMVKDWTLP